MITNPYTTSTSFYYSSQNNIPQNQFSLAISTLCETCSPTGYVNLYYLFLFLRLFVLTPQFFNWRSLGRGNMRHERVVVSSMHHGHVFYAMFYARKRQHYHANFCHRVRAVRSQDDKNCEAGRYATAVDWTRIRRDTNNDLRTFYGTRRANKAVKFTDFPRSLVDKTCPARLIYAALARATPD